MKKLGYLHTKTRSGLLVVRSKVDNPLRVVNAIVYDNSMRRLGIVVDVIGRVDSPFVVVKPDTPELVEELEPNTILYYYIPRPRRRGRELKTKGKRKPRNWRSR